MERSDAQLDQIASRSGRLYVLLRLYILSTEQVLSLTSTSHYIAFA